MPMDALPARAGSCSVVHSAPSKTAAWSSAAMSNQIHPPSLYWLSTTSNELVAVPSTSRESMRCRTPEPFDRYTKTVARPSVRTVSRTLRTSVQCCQYDAANALK